LSPSAPAPERPQARPGRLRGWLLNLLLILVIVAGIQWWKGRPLASGEAPSLSGTTLEGRTLDLTSERGRPVLVHFWATWCAVCRLGNGALEAVARDHRVITVALQSGDAAEIRRYLASEGLAFDVVPDETGALARGWGVPGVPATFVLDPAGRVAFSTLGLTTEWGLRARLWGAAHIH
jgi:thiol-disulfide isomerase/thioredoxin